MSTFIQLCNLYCGYIRFVCIFLNLITSFENRKLLLLWKINVLLTLAFSTMAYLCWCGNGVQGDMRMSLGSLTAFEKKKVTQQKNHNSYEFLTLMMLIQLDHSAAQKYKTFKFIPTFAVKLSFWGGRGKGRRLMISRLIDLGT